MRHLLNFTACLMAIASLTGCVTDTTEVRERMYIQCMVLDESDDKTFLKLYPFEGNGEPVTGSGASIYEAVEDAAVRSGKDVFLGHTELLCFKDTDFTETLLSCLTEYRFSPSCRLLYLHQIDLPDGTDTTLLTDSLTIEMEKGRIPETDLFTVLSKHDVNDILLPALTENGFTLFTAGKEIKQPAP